MASSRKSPRDATGRKAVELAEKNAEALAERAGEISTINPLPEVIVEADVDDVEVSDTVEVKEAFRMLRVNTDLEEITIGRGNIYTFKRGHKYKVPAHVYDHLEEKGYVYH